MKVLEENKKRAIPHQAILLMFSVFLLTAPWWAAYAQQIKGRTLFLTADS